MQRFLWRHLKVAVGLVFSEISADIEKIGRNLTVQVDGQNFYVSRGFAGGATFKYDIIEFYENEISDQRLFLARSAEICCKRNILIVFFVYLKKI